MADEVVRLKIVVDEDVRGAKKAKAAVDDVTKSTEKLGDEFKDAAKDAKSFEERLKDLTDQRAEYARKAIDADGDDRRAHIRRYNAISREIGLLHKLKQVSDEAFGNDSDGSDSGLAFRGTGIPSLSLAHAMPAAGPMIATGIAAAAPAAIYGAGAIGAGLAGAVGGVGVIAGLAGAIAASIKSPEVQAAAKSFGGDLGATFFGAGGASVKPVVQSLAMLSDEVKRLGLAELFGKAAPAITTFAGGIGDLVANLMPGFNRLMDDAEPYAEALAEGLGETGDALSHLLTSIADSKGDIQGLRGLFDLINGTIEYTGDTVGWLSDRWYDFNVGIGAITGALEDFTPSWTAVGMQLRKGNDLTEEYTDKGEDAYRVIRELNKEVRDQAVALTLANLATANAAERTKNYKEWLDKVNGSLSDSISQHLDYEKLLLSQKDSLRGFKDQLKENKGQWDANTEAGNANRQALLEQIATAGQVRDKAIEMGDGSAESQRKAQKEYNKTVDMLLAIAAQAGLSEAALKRMEGTYKIQVVAEVIGQQVVDWSVLRNKERKAEGRASGGPVLAGVPYMINERGRETVTFGANGMVHPANLTPAAAARSSTARPVQLDGGGLGQVVFNWLVTEIGNRGGTLAALGIRD